MMHKYRKKPVEIEAIQWTGENTTQILTFCRDCFSYQKNSVPVLVINTLEGNMTASIGDYVIQGIKGEFYACKPDIFEMTYDKVTN